MQSEDNPSQRNMVKAQIVTIYSNQQNGILFFFLELSSIKR